TQGDGSPAPAVEPPHTAAPRPFGARALPGAPSWKPYFRMGRNAAPGAAAPPASWRTPADRAPRPLRRGGRLPGAYRQPALMGVPPASLPRAPPAAGTAGAEGGGARPATARPRAASRGGGDDVEAGPHRGWRRGRSSTAGARLRRKPHRRPEGRASPAPGRACRSP